MHSIHRNLRLGVLIVVSGALLWEPAVATGAGGEGPSLFRGVQLYYSRDFAACIEELSKVAQFQNTSSQDRTEAYVFMAASYYRLGKSSETMRLFDKCVRGDPSYTIGLDFPPDIRSVYLDLKRRLVVSATITSEPSGVSLYLDGNLVGVTPHTEDTLLAGSILEVRLTGNNCYHEIDSHVTIDEGKSNLYTFNLARRFCKLSLSPVPHDAKVVILDRQGLESPWADSLPCGGEFQLRFTRRDYWDTTVLAGCEIPKTKSVAVTMRRRPSNDGLLKYWTSIACIAATGGYVYLQTVSDKSYDRYMQSVNLEDIGRNWRDYNRKAKLRNLAGWTATGLAVVTGYLWSRYVFSARTGQPGGLTVAGLPTDMCPIAISALDGRPKVVFTADF